MALLRRGSRQTQLVDEYLGRMITIKLVKAALLRPQGDQLIGEDRVRGTAVMSEETHQAENLKEAPQRVDRHFEGMACAFGITRGFIPTFN